ALTEQVVVRPIEIRIDGYLSSRPKSDPRATWSGSIKTPATILVKPGLVYQLSWHNAGTEKDNMDALMFPNLISFEFSFFFNERLPGLVAELKHSTPLIEEIIFHDYKDMGCDITDRELESMQGLTRLRVLRVPQCPEITDRGLSYIRNLIWLEDLNLCSWPGN